MADDNKNILDAGKVDEFPKSGKTELVKTDSPMHDQPTPAEAGGLVVEDASTVVSPPVAEAPQRQGHSYYA